jgi:hypothetical protein
MGRFSNATTLKLLAIVVPAAVAGCASAPTESGGNEALGIVEFQSNASGSGLVITGLDGLNNPVGRVEVTVGTFVMSDTFAEDRAGADRSVDGRRIDIEFRGLKLHHESEGRDPLRLPLPPLAQYDEMKAFLADTHVLPLLENQGVSFRLRLRTASAVNGIAYSNYGLTHCSSYDSHHLGPGEDCQQYTGNDPNGFNTNTCASHGANSLGCTDTSIADSNVLGGFYTDLFQCCLSADLDAGASEKTCVPQSGGVSPCGKGGGFGCAVCFGIGVSSCRTWCQGSGDNCDDGNQEQACSDDTESEIHIDYN